MVLLYKVKEVYMQDYKNLDFINNLKKTIDKTKIMTIAPANKNRL